MTPKRKVVYTFFKLSQLSKVMFCTSMVKGVPLKWLKAHTPNFKITKILAHSPVHFVFEKLAVGFVFLLKKVNHNHLLMNFLYLLAFNQQEKVQSITIQG